MPKHEQKPEQPEGVDYRPWLVIPYWTSQTAPMELPDDGTNRPLEPWVVSYLCPGIRTSSYTPGEKLTVEVDVANYGGGTVESLAIVTVWWTDPTPGFVIDPNKLVGVALVEVPPRGTAVTADPITAVIPTDAPPHICLIAQVTHSLDPAGALPDPTGDRHWAQRNIWVINPAASSSLPSEPIEILFWAGNPSGEEASFFVYARPINDNHAVALSQVLGGQFVHMDASLALAEGEPGSAGQQAASDYLSIRLAAGERRAYTARLRMGWTPRPGDLGGFEIRQLSREEQLIGSLGIIVRSEHHG